jgi:MFS family permease
MPRSKLFLDLGPLRTYPDFRRVFIGVGVAQIGNQLGTVAIALQVYDVTRSNLDVGFISLVQLVPAFLGSVFGGAIADALDRRIVLLFTGTGMVACTVGLALNAASHRPSLTVLYVIAGVNAGIYGCDGPTRVAVLITMVERADLVPANALRQIVQQISVVVGPAIGGILIASSGVTVGYWVNAGALGLSLLTVLTIGPRPPVGGGTKFGVASIVEGFTFLRGRPAIQGCFVADLDAMILGMPTALFPALGLMHFHGGSQAVGYLYAAPGAGALVATIFSGWANHVRRPGLAVCASIVVWGVSIAVFGLLGSLPLALVLLGVAGGADVISAVFRSTILQAETPDRLRGRLSSLQTAVVTAGPRLGNLEAGGVAAAFGTTFSVVSGGLGCVAGVAVIARLMPRFVRYELPRAGEEAPVAAST